MSQRTRSNGRIASARGARAALAALAAISLFFVGAEPASAGGGRKSHHRGQPAPQMARAHHADHDAYGAHRTAHRHGDHREPRVRVHVHGPSCDYRSSRSHVRHDRHAGAHHVSQYYCEPCAHRFHSRHAFHRHIHASHAVPIWQIPLRVAFHYGFGFVFAF